MDRRPSNRVPQRELSQEELARRRAARARQQRRQELERRRKEKRRKSVLGFMAIVFMITALVLIGILFYLNNEEQREIKTQRELQNRYATTVAELQMRQTVQPQLTEQPQSAEPTEPELTSVDSQPMSLDSELPILHEEELRISPRLEEFYEINPDLIGWVEMGNVINVPVVLRDNEYYMSRNFFGSSSKNGTVFADEKNADWQNSPYMLLYGHNMREGIMFGRLDELKEIEGFRRNSLVQFYTLYNDEVHNYLPFAVVDASVSKNSKGYFDLRRFDIFEGETRDEQKINEFVAEIMDRSIVSVPGVEVTPDDRILGLVTCSYSSDNARLIVFCREVRENENVNDMSGYVSAIAQMK